MTSVISTLMAPLRQLFASSGGIGTDPQSAIVQVLCEPVSADNPCGESLEYDTDYAVLQARLNPKADVQYGSFTSKPDAPDWVEVERDARRLLQKSKDISLLIWFTRARTRMAGARGLLEGLATLQSLLLAYPDHIHPRIIIDGQNDPAVRTNALAALCDPEGLLGDIRDVVVASGTASRLSVRDVERAFAVPRNPYAADPQHIKRQLAHLHGEHNETLLALLASASCAQDIAQWATETLQDDAPELSPLLKLLAVLASFSESVNTAAKIQALEVEQVRDEPSFLAAPNTQPDSVSTSLQSMQTTQEHTALAPGNMAQQREQIYQLLGHARQWIDQHEPSSPVSILLKQAQRMWGKRFSEVAGMIPADLLQAWDRDE